MKGSEDKHITKQPGRWFKKSCSKLTKKATKPYGVLKLISALSAVYIAIVSYAPRGTFGIIGGFVTRRDNDNPPNDPNPGFPEWLDQSGMHLPGYIIDTASEERNDEGVILTRGSERAIVAESDLQMFCLGITRISAFLMYPSLVLVFTTKFRATMEMIMQSPLIMFTYEDLHELHIWCGWVVVIDGALHTLFHIIRWADQGNLELIFQHRSGISGFVSITCIILIGAPMMFECLRSRIRFEVRKYLHYFFVVFCIAMSFHAPLSTIPNGGFAAIVFPTIIIWYTLDSLYVYLCMTEKIETTTFHVMETGVQLTMSVSESFQKRGGNGGYCYVNFPWINKRQWHAFSLFENPANPSERQIYIQQLGDWTNEVLQALKQRETRRPIWVMGPFSSPYDSAVEMDNQILVAGGIGITPAISVMRNHAETRRSNLIWAVRDPHMLEFFVKHGTFSTRGWNLIFYTGKQPLYVGSSNEILTASGALVHIIRSRPNIADLIPNIIYSIESGKFVPEAFVSETKGDAIVQLKDKLIELDSADIPTDEMLNEVMEFSDNLGFLFSDLMSEISKGDPKMKEYIQKYLLASEDTVSPLPSFNESLGNGKGKKGTSSRKSLGDALVKRRRSLISTRSSLGSSFSVRQGPRGGRSSTLFLGASLASCMEDGNGTVNAYSPWEEDSEESRVFVNKLDQAVLDTWGCLYCGGQGPLAHSLKKTVKKIGISVALESFKW